MDHPVLVFVPTLRCCCSWACRSCTCASTRPTPRSCRPACPRGRRTTCSPARLRRGRVRAACCWPSRTDGPVDRSGERGAALRLLAPPRRRSARVSRVDELWSTSTRAWRCEQYQLLYAAPGGPADRYIAETPGRDTKDDLAGVHRLHALRPQPRRRPGAGRRPAQPGLQPRPAAGHDGAGRRRRGRGARRRGSALPPTSRARRCSS